MDWKRIASERLKELHRRERVAKDRMTQIADIVERAMRRQIHRRCLVSVNDEQWRECIRAVANDVAVEMERV